MSGAQIQLLAAPSPRPVPGIDLRCCDVAEVLADVRGARLIHADPPWLYDIDGVRLGKSVSPSRGGAVLYAQDDNAAIAAAVDAAFDAATDGARLALWCTFPKLAEWMSVSACLRWRYVSGGAWGKVAGEHGSCGVGYHWRGRAEVLLLYVKGSPPTDRQVHLSNHHVAPTTEHSEKPMGWQRTMLQSWTAPNDLVLDLYAGLAPMARACALEGRRYVGAEIDPERHRMALDRLARAVAEGEDFARARPSLFGGVGR